MVFSKKKKIFSFRPLENGDLQKKVLSYSDRRELNASVDGTISFLVGLVFDSILKVLNIEKEDIWLLFG